MTYIIIYKEPVFLQTQSSYFALTFGQKSCLNIALLVRFTIFTNEFNLG